MMPPPASARQRAPQCGAWHIHTRGRARSNSCTRSDSCRQAPQLRTRLDASLQMLKLGRHAKEIWDGNFHRQALVHAAAAGLRGGVQLVWHCTGRRGRCLLLSPDLYTSHPAAGSHHAYKQVMAPQSARRSGAMRHSLWPPGRAPLELALRLPHLAAAGQHRILHTLKQLLRGIAEAEQGEAARHVHAVAGADTEHAARAGGAVGRRQASKKQQSDECVCSR